MYLQVISIGNLHPGKSLFSLVLGLLKSYLTMTIMVYLELKGI